MLPMAHGVGAMRLDRDHETNIMLASDPSLEGVSGQYYDQCELAEYSSQGDDEALRKKLWDLSEELTAA